jgi:mannose/fructose/N-acetylgalactosamine-specific phosphotransferase system component IIC
MENLIKEENFSQDFAMQIKLKSDKLMNYFLIGFFTIGLLLAFYYSTWLIAIGVGGLSLLAYYSAKLALPKSDFISMC